MLILSKILFIQLLLVCCVEGICSKDNCQINSNNVEYLNTVPLSVLNMGDTGIKLPIPQNDYNIPDINSISINKSKIGKELNICPPGLSIDFSESCLISNKSVSN